MAYADKAKEKVWRDAHKEEKRESDKRYRARVPRPNRSVYHRERRYGITRDEFVAKFKAQAGRCEVCKRLFTYDQVCVDHSHDTEEVRGLLCNKCNLIVGVAENGELLGEALRYLGRYREC